MDKVSIIGFDISKTNFQVHGATADGAPELGDRGSRVPVVLHHRNDGRRATHQRAVRGADADRAQQPHAANAYSIVSAAIALLAATAMLRYGGRYDGFDVSERT